MMSIYKATGGCMICGEDGTEKSCGRCEEGYHVACARKRGALQVQEHGNVLVSSSRVNYEWECPNCGHSVRGTM